LGEFGDRYSQARTYHQLGTVAQELREYAEARRYYQQALEILGEFGDRYSQASTYFHHGQVAEALGNLEEAKVHYLQDLQIIKEFNDGHWLDISLQNLARFYKATQDKTLLSAVATMGIDLEALSSFPLE
jgi:tetratricopeptide (TPR) repeat protein